MTGLFAQATLVSQIAQSQGSGWGPEKGSPKLQWLNLPESWGVFVFVAILGLIVFAVFWLYKREQKTCPRSVKWLLASMRLAVLLFLVAMLLRPSMFYQQVNEIKPSIGLVRDASLSIQRSDRYADASTVRQLANALEFDPDEIKNSRLSRVDLINRALDNDVWLSELRERGNVKVIDFSNGIRTTTVIPASSNSEGQETASQIRGESGSTEKPINDDSGELMDRIPTLSADGLGTDLWLALRNTLESETDISSVVLVSDGQHNGTENPIEMAELAAGRGVPIFTVGIGDPNPPRNISVDEVFVRSKSYPGEPFEIEALIQAISSDDELPDGIKIQLVEEKIDANNGRRGQRKIVETREVKVPENAGRVRVDFSRTVDLPGEYIYTILADEIPNEINKNDNARESSNVQVVDEKVRVLLISGLPSWDYQQVQRLLQRDQTIELSCWLQSMDQSRPQEGDFPISQLPQSIEDLGQYNVVILMDPNPQEFDARWIEMLKVFCKNKAGGVLFMAGPQFTSEFVTLNRLSGIRDLLPVRMGDIQFIDSTDALSFATTSMATISPVRHNLDHPVLSFHSDAVENEKRWASLPGLYWNFPTMTAKPTARVLLRRLEESTGESPMPIMVSGRFGAGNVLYMGFQGTWRWRPAGLQALFFDRFWIQVVRYLIENRSLQGSRRGFVDSDRTDYELGDRIVLIGQILDPQFRPSKDSNYNIKLVDESGRSQTVSMQLLPGTSGQYEGSFVASRTGTYSATIDLGDSSEELIEPISFRVTTPQIEANSFWLNEKLLIEIAETSGGEYFRLDEIANIPAKLPKRVKRIAFKSPAQPLWDWNQTLRSLAFLVPVILLSVEWSVRKWYKLL